MALRTDEDNPNSPLSGLIYFWQDAEKPSGYDWEQWIQLFEVATLARRSIPVSEVLRVAVQQNPRTMSLMGNLEEVSGRRKMVKLLYISSGKTARKMVLDKFPTINILLYRMLSNTTQLNSRPSVVFLAKTKTYGVAKPSLERAQCSRSKM